MTRFPALTIALATVLMFAIQAAAVAGPSISIP